MRKFFCAVGTVALLVGVAAAPAGAAPLVVTAPKSISIATPFAPGCGGATEGSVPGANFN